MNNHFVHLDYPTTHSGVVRAEQAVEKRVRSATP